MNREIDQATFDQVLRRAVLPPLIVMAVLAVILLIQVYRLLSVNDLVQHSDTVIATTHELERRLINMEAGIRGYVLTDSPEFLAPYDQGKREIEPTFVALKILLDDQPEQEARIQKVVATFRKWVILSDATQTSLNDVDRQAIDWRLSKSLMDTMRQQMDAIVQSESATRNDRQHTARQTTVTAIVLAIAFAGIAAVLLAMFNRRQLIEVTDAYNSMLHSSRTEMEVRRGVENRFRRLLDGGAMGAAISDAKGQLVDANDVFLRMIGYTRGELEFSRLLWSDLTPAEFRMLDELAAGEVRARGICTPYEKQLIARNGKHIPVLVGGGQADESDGTMISWVVDLASAKQAEQAIRQSETLLRSITDSLPVLVSYVDTEQRYRFNNKAYEEWFGYSRTDLQGKHLRDVLSPTGYEEAQPYMLMALGGERVQFESRLMSKNHGLRDVNVEYLPQPGLNGAIDGYVTLVTDISDRLAILNREKEARIEAEIVNELGKALSAELDLEKLIQAITDAARDLSGAEFGAFFYNVIRDDVPSYMLYSLSGAPREKFSSFPMPRKTEVFGPTFDGQPILRSDDITKDPRYGKNAPFFGMPKGHLPVVSYLAASVVSRAGEVIGGLFYGHTKPARFTEHHERLLHQIATQAAVLIENARLVDALKVSEERFRQMADGAPVLIWLSGTDRRCHWFNKAWLEFTGRTLDEERGHDWQETVHPDDLEQSRAIYADAFDSQHAFRVEYRLQRHDGEYRWVIDQGVPLYGAQREFTGFIGSCIDITDRKRADEEREQLLARERTARSDAELANRMKDEFLSNLSHELRTPLNAIMGWADLLGMDETTDEEFTQGVEVIRRNARLQAHLIEDLLDMSRIISGKIRLEVQRIDIADVVQQAIDVVRPSADAKNIQLQVTLSQIGRQVAGDPSRLQQVIWNLLSNAIKFSDKQGRLQVLLERVNSHVEITVSDTGQGIDPAFLPFVFDRFRQADATTTRKFGGMGLGLAIVKQLVELHGGSVSAKSAGLGHGSTFVVKLPLTSVQAQDDGADRVHPRSPQMREIEPADLARLENLRVLVVDDEADARALVQRILAGYSAQVETAANVDEALAKLADQKFDVLVSDIGMSDKDGYELIRCVREREQATAEETMPAVALTAFARSEDRQRALRAGFQMHVAKPVEPAELMVVVATLARRTVPDETA